MCYHFHSNSSDLYRWFGDVFCKDINGRSLQSKTVTLAMEEFMLQVSQFLSNMARCVVVIVVVVFFKREEKYLVKEQLFRSPVTDILICSFFLSSHAMLKNNEVFNAPQHNSRSKRQVVWAVISSSFVISSGREYQSLVCYSQVCGTVCNYGGGERGQQQVGSHPRKLWALKWLTNQT